MADGLLSGAGRRAALDDIGAGLIRYIPPEWRALAGLIAEANPVRGIERAGQAARRLAAPEAAPMERVAATGNVLSEMAGVLAPAAVAGRAGMPAVQAVQEGLLGMSAPARAAGEAVIERLNQPGPMPTLYSNPIMRAPSGGFTTWHGSPHIFKAERLVRMPDGSTQYLVGDVDRLPDVPPGAQVIEDFPMGRFRMSQIGTGEGNQAYGQGLYVAENRGVAQGYRDNLAGRGAVMGGAVDGLPDRWQMEVYQALSQPNGPIRAAAIRNLKDRAPPEYANAIDAALNYQGRLYEVNIAANPEEFIDWDAPLSAQPEAVRRVADETYHGAPSPLLTGEEIMNNVFTQVNPARRSAAMREAGIPGVRYLDAGSRGAGEGSRNYVLFNEDLMRIVRVYGIAGAAAMLGMSTGEVEAAVRQAQGRSVPGLLNMPSDEELRLKLSTYLNGG